MSDQKICPTCGTEYPLSERFCPRDGTALRSAVATSDLLGQIVADRYHVMKKLGEGGMGTVYLAEHVKMGRKSALKVMNPGMNTDPDAIARFNREASNASRLSHPNICAIYDFGETPEGLIYLAMEFIEGSSLTSLVEKAGSLPAARCGSIIHQTADALQVAHDAGIVHRDLKPDNIMIARHRDGSDLVKVVDFGIAKASSSDAQKVTKTGLVVGTPEYMSPEQLAGDKLDGKSDIYSLGLVAFHCLTGKLPFPAETVQEAMIMRLTDKPHTLAQARPDVAWPAELQRTLDRALERDASVRYQSAAAFGREFAAAIAEMPATKAAEAGTLVMGATGAANMGNAGKTGDAKALPPTRVERASGKTVPMEAPVAPRRGAAPAGVGARAPERKSSRVPIIAGAATVMMIAVVTVVMLPKLQGNGSPTGTQGATGDTSASLAPADSQAGSANPVASVPDTQASAADPGGTKIVPLSNPVNPGTRPDRTGGTTGGATTNPNTPVTPDATRVVSGWRQRLVAASEGNAATYERAGHDALREIEPLLGTLGGTQRDNARFVAMMAYGAIDDVSGMCRMARFVRETRLSSEDKAILDGLTAGQGC